MKKRAVLFALLLVIVLIAVAAASTGGGDRWFKPEGVKPVFFSHERHVNVRGAKCSACHYHAFQMAQETYEMDMDKLNKGKFCGICHNGERSFDVKDKANCDKCHK